MGGKGDGPGRGLQHQRHQSGQRQSHQPLWSHIQNSGPGHVAAGAEHAGDGGDRVGVDGDGGEAGHCQSGGDIGRFPEELEEGENKRLEHGGHQNEGNDAQCAAHQHGEEEQTLAQGHDLLLGLAFADGFAQNHRRGSAEAEADHQEQTAQIAHDGVGRQHFHAVVGVAQNDGEHGVACAPDDLVDHHGGGVADEAANHIHTGTEEAAQIQRNALVAQCGNQADHEFHHTAQQCGQRRAGNAHGGEAELTENQQVVEHGVDKSGGTKDLHAEIGIFHAALNADIHRGEHIEHIGKADNAQIRRAQHAELMLVAQKIHHLNGEEIEDDGHNEDQSCADGGGHTHGAVDVLRVLFAPVLAHQNAKTALDAEHHAEHQKYRHVGGGHGGHLRVAQLADHEGVDEAEGESDEVLQDHGGAEPQQIAVEGGTAVKMFKHMMYLVGGNWIRAWGSAFPCVGAALHRPHQCPRGWFPGRRTGGSHRRRSFYPAPEPTPRDWTCLCGRRSLR